MTMVRCEVCQGARTVVCPECGGRATDSLAQDACGTCGGSGRVTCLGCLGSGFVDMPTLA